MKTRMKAFLCKSTICLVVALCAHIQSGFAETLTLQFKGSTNLVEADTIPIIKELPEDIQKLIKDSLCYQVPIRDPETGFWLGRGFDCLSNITVNEQTGSITATDVAIFLIGRSAIVSIGDVTIQENLTENTERVTHITGSFPKGRNIVYTRGKFENHSGRVRLSGGVNMQEFPKRISFDCLFIIDLKENIPVVDEF